MIKKQNGRAKHSLVVGLAASLILFTAGPRRAHAADSLTSLPLVPSTPSALAAAMVVPTAQEASLLDLINADRLANGLSPVQFDPALLGIARARAMAQLTPAGASHYDAEGALAFVGLLDAAQLDFSRAGENLALLADGPTAAVLADQALMNSLSHRQNILEPSFSGVAVGSAVDGSGQLAFAQIFRAMP